jgi:uncharacterized protein YdeI (YjbR/CyaY-like superfamily)
MEIRKGIKAVYARTRKTWRNWLAKNHESEKSVWLIIHHKSSAIKSVYYDEAIEEALCFGWIDSTANKRDHESSYLLFARRKPRGVWSQKNKERVRKLTDQGLMTPAGQAMIDLAKKNGMWDARTEVEQGVIPSDLKTAFNKNKTALKNFMLFPPSSKRMILAWISDARRPETRAKRINESVKLAAKNIRANHYRPKP